MEATLYKRRWERDIRGNSASKQCNTCLPQLYWCYHWSFSTKWWINVFNSNSSNSKVWRSIEASDSSPWAYRGRDWRISNANWGLLWIMDRNLWWCNELYTHACIQSCSLLPKGVQVLVLVFPTRMGSFEWWNSNVIHPNSQRGGHNSGTKKEKNLPFMLLLECSLEICYGKPVKPISFILI